MQALVDKVEDGDKDQAEAGEHASSDSERSSLEEVAPEPTPAQSISKKRKGKDVAREEEDLSYRELQGRAYSQESLHHHKSGRSGSKNERGTGHNSRGVARGAFAQRGRGSVRDRGRGGRGRGGDLGARGGQPDMRLRMTALLEKIKHDVAK